MTNSSSRTRASSSAQSDVARSVLEGEKPFSSSSSTTRVARSRLLMAPGKLTLTSASNSGSSRGLSAKTWATLSEALVSPGAILRWVVVRPAGEVTVKACVEAARRASDARESFMVDLFLD